MLLLMRRIIKSLLITAIVGFVVRRLMASDNPRLKNVGYQANRFIGGPIGLDETGRRIPRRRRRAMTNSAGSAIVGGVMSYFFDPKQGRDRRERAKTFARERLARRNGEAHLLPEAPPSGTTGDAPYGSRSASAIT